jgi:MarR family transcriptional regulator, lower aerobic nicotinate degradation pathway regulator
MSMEELYQRPGFLFRRCRQRLGALYLKRIADVDLTLQQFTALHAINEYPWIEQTSLCNIIMLDRSTVATQLAKLEEKGLLTRKPASDNPRKNLIKLKPAGRSMLARVGPLLDSIEDDLLAILSPAERGTLIELLSRVADVQDESQPDL